MYVYVHVLVPMQTIPLRLLPKMVVSYLADFVDLHRFYEAWVRAEQLFVTVCLGLLQPVRDTAWSPGKLLSVRASSVRSLRTWAPRCPK